MTLFIAAALAMAVQGSTNIDIAHHWSFIVLAAFICLAVGWRAYSRDKGKWKGDRLCHGGLALLILTALVGYSWNERGQAILYYDEPVRIAYTSDGHPMALPFELQLKDFSIEYYEDNEHIMQYTSQLQIKDLTDKDSTVQIRTTKVNHPAFYHGYRLYQDSYDAQNERYSVIKIVKEPLMPLIYIAMLLIAAGIVLQIRKHWVGQQKWMWITTAALAVVFTLLSVMRIQFGYLMPALRSLWFVPHLACYMIAYALLAVALVLTAIRYHPSTVASSLLYTSSGLLLLGMLCGSVWAKQAWGDYWSWDPKECWAAATWLLSLAATHSHRVRTGRKVTRIVMMILCFIAMQVTWYGINYLPSAHDSVHTYNVKMEEWDVNNYENYEEYSSEGEYQFYE